MIEMEKVKVGIIGTGNIGSDLLSKVMKSEYLECGIFAGRNLESSGMIRAKQLGAPITDESVHYIEENPDCCEIVFDATSADVHKKIAPVLKEMGKFVVDLTPSNIGKFCIPAINGEEVASDNEVNMITCGGQATVPIAYAITRASNDVKYFEIVATIASKSAGIGTRNNIDEFTQTTKKAITAFTGVKAAKAIIVLNPADPPITMHNTLYALIDNPNMDAIKKSVMQMEKEIQKYVPGYRILTGPIYEDGRLITTVSVQGSGDYLPKYAGNLDIITCAALAIAEKHVKKVRYE